MVRSAGGIRGRRGGQLGGLLLGVVVVAVLGLDLGSFFGLGIFSSLVVFHVVLMLV